MEKINFNNGLEFNVAIKEEKIDNRKIFVARSLEIDIASQGNSLDEALINLREALNLYFEENPSLANDLLEEQKDTSPMLLTRLCL